MPIALMGVSRKLMIGRVCITNTSRHMIIGSLGFWKTNTLCHTHRGPKLPFYPFDIFSILQSSYPHPSFQESDIHLISTVGLQGQSQEPGRTCSKRINCQKSKHTC